MPQVVVAAVLCPLPQVFEYLPPATTSVTAIPPGSRIKVPFGRRHTVAVVLRHSAKASYPEHKLRRIHSVLDEQPSLTADALRMIVWASDYYHYPIGEAVRAGLPVLLREARSQPATRTPRLRLARPDAATSVDSARAPRQAAILAALAEHPGGLSPEALAARIKGAREGVKTLLAKDLIRQDRFRPEHTPPAAADVVLSAEQNAAVDAIDGNSDSFSVHLLDGVTGSGKTEVYLELIRRGLRRGKQCLVLIPEIGLTPQTVARFERGLGQRMSVFHSGLGRRERALAWLAARRAETRVVIGTRSAIFTPMPNLGLIVVDEEHDPSYKQMDGFRYSARDLSIVRASQAGIPVILGSATPGLDSLRQTETGRFVRHRLTRRARGARLPATRVVDLRRSNLESGLALELREAIARNVSAGHQTLLFLNRRGFAPTLLCTACGAPARCARCDANLVLHRARGILVCHHCAAQRHAQSLCEPCGGPLRAVGVGTERLHDWLKNAFPHVNILRFDRDSVRGKNDLHNALTAMHAGDARIIIGTQMLAKGHDLPGVTLVGIVDADAGFFGADLRAAERTAQLIVQVAGRAGRAQFPGEVYIQTYNPQSEQLTRLLTDGYHEFAAQALADRNAAQMPPFAKLALLRAEAHQREQVYTFLEFARETLERAAEAIHELAVLGPVPAPMERRAGQFRAQLMVHAASPAPLHRVLTRVMPELYGAPGIRRVRWSLDVDPHELL